MRSHVLKSPKSLFYAFQTIDDNDLITVYPELYVCVDSAGNGITIEKTGMSWILNALITSPYHRAYPLHNYV